MQTLYLEDMTLGRSQPQNLMHYFLTHNKNHITKHYHLYTIQSFLEIGTMSGTHHVPWADPFTVYWTIDYALCKQVESVAYNTVKVGHLLQQFIRK